MAILKSKLVQSKILQDILVDKVSGAPLSAGVITLYKDNSRTELKNWYYQSGQYPNYSYVPLPNPMTLSAAGTTVDESGNDILPMFYPYSESDDATPEFYYITVQNSAGQLQFSRSRFPWSPSSENPPVNETPTLKNLIINNRFWQALGTSDANGNLTNDLTSSLDQIVAPSQHDGFSAPDIRFQKDIAGSTDVCTFKKFLPGEEPFTNSIRSEFYLNHTCGSTGSSENYKYYLIPISLHIATLDSVQASFSIWLKSHNSTASNTISPTILQFTGSSAQNSPLNTQTLFPNGITPTSEWKQYTTTFTFQSTQDLIYDAQQVQDSAFYLELRLQTRTPIDIDIAIPSIYLGTTIPTTDFSTYDEIDTIINSPRTGDTRFSLNFWGYTTPSCWVAGINGTIGNSSSGATARANPDAWPLYSLIWNNVTNTICPLQNSSGTPIARGISAIADFAANNRLSLPLTEGYVLSNGINNAALGLSAGSPTTTLTTANLPAHTHTFSSDSSFFKETAGLPISNAAADYTFEPDVVSGTTGNGPGTSTPFSIVQPTTYLCLYFKL